MAPAQPFATSLAADTSGLIETLSAGQLADELRRERTVLVDLREQADRLLSGSIPGAVHIPADMLLFCANPALPIHASELDRHRRLVLYCATGHQSALAALMLGAMAYLDVARLDGGFEGWQQAGGAVEPLARTEALMDRSSPAARQDPQV